MFWKALDALFETRIWKITVILLSIFLFVSFIQLLIVANQSINLILAAVDNSAPGLKNYINSAYYNGIIAIIVFTFLSIFQITNIIRDHFIAQQYRVLANTMMKFADGDITIRHTAYAAKEVTQLGIAFNNMANSLQTLIEELRRSENRRKEIVANVVHDLAGPLTAISGYVDTLARGIDHQQNSKKIEYLEIIQNNVKTLTRLISELSDLSKLDVADFNIQSDFFSLRVLANDIVSRYELQAKNLSINLFVDQNSSNGLIYADIHLIERVISNLIENAISYTPANGQIIVSCNELENYVSLSVADTGIGIPEKDLPFVFERFYRVDKNRSRKTGGSGLGLAIAKEVVELHKGTISLASNLGEGTIIKLNLPKLGQESNTYHS